MGDSPSLQDVYAKNLQQSYGFPLRIPEPSSSLPESYHEDGLQIGDVGFVTSEGEFNVLFNIRYSSKHALHRRGVPDNFRPINLDLEEISFTRKAIPADRVISSPRLNRVLQSHDPSVAYEFFPSTSTGAILILPFGAIRHDLKDKEVFRRAAMEHGQSWCMFARRESLYLITGFYKASAWTLGSFCDAPGKHPRQIQVVKRSDNAGVYKWNHTFPVDWREGPEDQNNSRHNQTILINGFKIAVKWWARDPQIELMSQARRSLFIKACRFLFSIFLKPLRTTRIRVRHEPRLSEPFHPSDAINHFLLEKDPNARIAVTHDDQWTRMIEEKELTYDILVQEEDLTKYLSEHYSDCVISGEEYGAVYLQSKPSMVNTERLGLQRVVNREPPRITARFSVRPPSCGSSQSSVTYIRAEDIAAGLERVPIGFYVVFQFAGAKQRTKSKPMLVHESVIEWDDEIPLPSDPSVSIEVRICASFELSTMLGNGETLHRISVTVGDLIDNLRPFDFSPKEGQVKPWCSSLLIATGRRRFNPMAVDLDPSLIWEESSELARETDLGHDALLRYRHGYRKDDLKLSSSHFKHAFDICPDNHPCRAVVLFNQAMAECIACQVDEVNLAVPLSLYLDALKLRPVGHPDRPTTQLHLAQALLYRYGKQGYETSVASEIEQLVTELQAGCDVRSHVRRATDLVLQTYKTYKLVHSGKLAEIDDLISELNATVQTPPQGHFDRPGRLNNLSLALLRRFELLPNPEDASDVDRAISYLEEVLRSTSDDNPTKSSYLSNIGTSFLTRFNCLGELADLDQAISNFGEALRITPSEHPDRLILLNDLGNCFSIRFHRFNELKDVDQAILLLEDTVRSTPDGDLERPNRLHSLGNCFLARYKCLSKLVDLQQAISSFESAVELSPKGHPKYFEHLESLKRARQELPESSESGILEVSIEAKEMECLEAPPAPQRRRPRPVFTDPDSGSEYAGEETEDDNDDWSDDIAGELDSLTERNTKQNVQITLMGSDGLPFGEVDGDGEGDAAMDPDPLGEGVNVVVPPEPYFPSTLNRSSFGSARGKRSAPKRKKSKHLEMLPLITSRPVFQRDRCTITVTQGSPDASGRRKKTYVVASDMSEESRYALEWGIGTVLRDGDELLIVTIVENESKVDPPALNPADRTTKLRNQQERQSLTYILLRQATSLLQRTRLNVTISCQAWHAKNVRRMLLDIVDYHEPTMLIVGSQGLNQVRGIFLESTSDYLIQRCSVPVMVARRRLKRPPKRSAHLVKHRVHLSLAEAGIDRVAAKVDHDVAVMRDEMQRDDSWRYSNDGFRGIDEEEEVEGEGEGEGEVEGEGEETVEDGEEGEGYLGTMTIRRY